MEDDLVEVPHTGVHDGASVILGSFRMRWCPGIIPFAPRRRDVDISRKLRRQTSGWVVVASEFWFDCAPFL